MPLSTKSNTPRTDDQENLVALSPFAPAGFVQSSFARQLETELQQSIRREVLEKCVEALKMIRQEHSATMREVTEIGYSEGLCLKPSQLDTVDKALTLAQRELERTK